MINKLISKFNMHEHDVWTHWGYMSDCREISIELDWKSTILICITYDEHYYVFIEFYKDNTFKDITYYRDFDIITRDEFYSEIIKPKILKKAFDNLQN